MYQQGIRSTNYQRHEQKVPEFDTFSCEPLFLVKWKQLSYSQITWEPLSVLNGDNFKRVKEFLNAKPQISMRTRLLNAKNISNYQRIIDIGDELRGKVAESKIFRKQKTMLDNYIYELFKSQKLRTQD